MIDGAIDRLVHLLGPWRRRRWRGGDLGTMAALQPVVVVTGGSDGIGLALAHRFATRGARLLLIARGSERLAKGAMRLGSTAEVLALDVTAANATAAIDAKLAAMGGYCDVLVNAAGIGLAGPFEERRADEVRRLADLNVTALTVLTRHVLAGMRARGHGGVLNIASLGGYAPGPYQAAYYASKAYVLSLTEAIAHETAGHGVLIAVAAPGPVRTAFHQRMGGESGLYLRLMPVPSAEMVARKIERRFRLGQRVIIPGLMPTALMLAVRVLPHRLTMPIIAFLLKPRRFPGSE